MALSNWLNTDKWGVLRDKFNAVRALLQGGTAGQKLVSTAGGDPQWVDDNTSLPSQTGQSGKYLTTDGTTPSWVTIVIPTAKSIFLLGRSGTINSNLPNSGVGGQGPSQIGASIVTPNDGFNRDCLLSFTVDVSGISTAPDDYIGFYKNGVILKDFYFVVRTDYTAGLIASGTFVATNCDPNTVFTLQIKVTGSSNQVKILTYSFTCLGNPL